MSDPVPINALFPINWQYDIFRVPVVVDEVEIAPPFPLTDLHP
jgi:hypothetical protein